MTLLVGEMWRHSKAVGALGDDGRSVLEAAGVPVDGAGIVVGDDPAAPADLLGEVATLLSLHRVWERFTPASA